jgi:hypothetical protein
VAAVRWRWSFALTLAVVAVLLPTAAPVARAAEELRLTANTTYRIDPGNAVVRVRIDVKATNLKPNSVRRTATQVITTRYYYDRLLFNIQREARSVRASSDGSSLRVSAETKTNHRLLTVRIPNLNFRQTRSIRIEYDLPSGKPRSSGDIRVGAAFTTFTAWAWGDPGRSTVRVVMPKGFTDKGYGETLMVAEEDGRIVMSSGTIKDPGGWYAVIIADRPSALTDVRVGTADSPIVIQAWPEDTVWRDQVSRVLDDGVPVLQELIELEWPVTGDLTVTEVHSPLLEGYAGIYESLTDEIRISEDLDAQTILHEASHAWFDRAFVDERWITEGLAEEYAARARAELGLKGPADPEPADREGTAAFPLDDWPQPGRIDDKETAAREDYGYAASWTVMREIVDEAGEEGMRAVFHAIAQRTIPYVGDRAPETGGRSTDWRQFLDLVQEVGGADGAEALFRTWVVPATANTDLTARGAARHDYHALEAAGGEWAPPYLVRENLWLWEFREATVGMTAAAEVLADRDALTAVSARLGVSTPNDLETRFEEAIVTQTLDEVEVELEHRAAVAETLIATRDQLAAPRTPLADLGMAGELPTAGLDAGLAAYTAGDLDGALAGAAATSALLVSAEETGKGRAIAIGAAVVGLLVLLLVAIWLLRRRRRRRALGVAVVVAPPAVAGAVPDADVDAWSAPFAGTDVADPGAAPDSPTTLAATPDPAAVGADPPPAVSPPAPGVDPD